MKGRMTRVTSNGVHEQRLGVLMMLKDETLQSKGASFVNDGSFAWMVPFLKPWETGKTVVNGIPMDMKADVSVSEEDAAEKRRRAALDLVNIGPEERERRRQFG